MSTEAMDIDKRIKRRVFELLDEHSIYDIDSYGWLNHEDADPQYAGHTIRQTSSPTEEIFYFPQQEPPAPVVYPRWIERASVTGADFEGLMQSSRISIGLALFQYFDVGERFDELNSFLRVHLLAGTISLSTASDRLRDLLVASLFMSDSEGYAKRSDGLPNKREFIAPFLEGAQIDWGVNLSEPFDALIPLVRRCQEFRKERNQLIHNVATEVGMRRKFMIDSARAPQGGGYIDFEKIEEAWDAFMQRTAAEERQRDLNAINFPKEWYVLLVDMSNYVFLIEERVRTARAHRGV